MKQFQIVFGNERQFEKELLDIREKHSGKKAVIQFFYDIEKRGELEKALSAADRIWSEAECFGCASNSNIRHGRLSELTVLAVVMVFENEDTRLKILSFKLTNETQRQMCDILLEEADKLGWVKGIEMLVTIRDLSTTYICDRLSQMPQDIAVFGGAAFTRNADRYSVEVFSKRDGFLSEGAVFLLMGGSDLHFSTTYISGWKTLGADMEVSRSEKNRLYELNGEPAYEAYNRYLNIGNDDHFYYNALEFPISYERNGISILRVPSKAMPDGSIVMSSDIAEGAKAKISYGDPQTILTSIFDTARSLADFSADSVMIFNCASRRSFWGSEDIDRETMPFQLLADTAGFYTGGEFHRMGWSLNQHNVTLVIVGIREGGVDDAAVKSAHERLERYFDDNSYYHGEHVSMVRRLANFIDVASNELADANRRLSRMATTDELTGLFNRREIKKRIMASDDYSLIMFDLDFFKHINDTYGHDEGDLVLKAFSDLLYRIVREEGAYAGRWGGEEFMVLVQGSDIRKAFALAERVRTGFGSMAFDRSGVHTVSCGVAVHEDIEAYDSVCTRVDDALYKAKRQGRNCTCVN